MPFPRSSGVLLHPTSFPSRFGVGDLGSSAYQFLDFLHESGQQIWQVLPLGPTAYGNSPYMCYSSLAGNPLLISPELLRDQGLLTDDDLANYPEFSPHQVDYDRVIAAKMPLLLKAAENFKAQAGTNDWQAYEAFCASRAFWLNDYAFFMALKHAHNGAGWHQWDKAIGQRQQEAMHEWGTRLSEEIFYHKFLQFEFFRQWSEIKGYAGDRGIYIVGDIPIYVAHDSADVWASPQYFHLDEETGEPALMAGVPPDYFSATGQLWGNPIYNWEVLEKHNFDWWIRRFRAMLEYVDLIRIDHFRGFRAYWVVRQGETTAMNGEWVQAPGEAFFEMLKRELGNLPILAEDLGVITPDVEALRDQFEFPGMKVIQFAFGSDANNPFLPYNYERNYVVYTGTHDNNTTVGWFHELPEAERKALLDYLGCGSAEGIHWDLIRLALASVANQAIFPLQDILGLGGDARMNFPGKAEGNWAWRYTPEQLSTELSDRLSTLTRIYGRGPARPRR